MNVRYYLATLALLCTSGVLAAQTLPYSIEVHEQTASLGPGGYVEFKMFVKNETDANLRLNVVRSTNQLPDSAWITAICFDDLCFGDTVSFPPELSLKPGQSRLVKINVLAGNALNTQGRVVLQFSTFGGQNMSEKEFMVTVAASSVGYEHTSAMPAYPNPAVGTITLPLPAAAKDLSLGVFDSQGNRVLHIDAVRNDAGSLVLPVDALPGGAYRYAFASGGRIVESGGFVVRR